MKSEIVAMVAGQLMGGSHPDQIHEVHTLRFVKMAKKIVDEAETECEEVAPKE